MIFDDLAHIGQAQTEAFHVVHIAGGHAEEAIEYLFQILLLDADTIVLDGDQQLAVLVPGAAHQFEGHVWAAILHGVVHQVEQDIGDVHLVHINIRVGRLQINV